MRNRSRMAGLLVGALLLLPVVATTAVATESAAKRYTMAQVAKHRTATDCWTVVNGTVYDVTRWVARHPGGRAAITGLCGKDGTAMFTGQHRGDRNPAAMLRTFKIGVVR